MNEFFLWETVITILYNPEQKKILLIFVHIYQFQRIKITFKNHQHFILFEIRMLFLIYYFSVIESPTVDNGLYISNKT